MRYQSLWKLLTGQALPTAPVAGSMAEYAKRADAAVSTRASGAVWTPAKAAYLDAAVSSRAAASVLTAQRAAYLDAAVSSRALASILTPTRAARLDSVGGTTKHQAVRPNLSVGVGITSGSLWAYGPWVQLIASGSIGTDFSIIELIITSRFIATGETFFNIQTQAQIGTGNSGSEVTKAELAFAHIAIADAIVSPSRAPLIPPLLIPANTRVAVRMASDEVAFMATVQAAVLP